MKSRHLSTNFNAGAGAWLSCVGTLLRLALRSICSAPASKWALVSISRKGVLLEDVILRDEAILRLHIVMLARRPISNQRACLNFFNILIVVVHSHWLGVLQG